MDRRIPPEPPVPVAPIRRDVVELKVKQGVHKEAFDSALQRADRRRTMGSSERVVAADIKQSHNAQRFDARNNPLLEARTEAGTTAKPSALRQSESAQKNQPESGIEFVQAHLGLHDFSAASPDTQGASVSTRTLGDESMTMLYKKINSNLCALGENLELEFIDDPSGVLGIKLTKSINNSWAITLLLEPNEKRANEDEDDLSQNLISQMRQSGISVDAVSVEVSSHATHAVVI